MTDPAQIARGLSNAGRKCLDWVRPCSLIAPYRAGAGEVLALGLVRRDGPWFIIEPLGLAVRAELEKMDG